MTIRDAIPNAHGPSEPGGTALGRVGSSAAAGIAEASETELLRVVRSAFRDSTVDESEVTEIVERAASAVTIRCREDGEPISLDFLDPPGGPNQIGTFDGYEVESCVGCGGMGIVFKAFDPTLRRVVALKVLTPRLAARATARARFLREARAVAAVNHEHVVRVYAVGESRGLPYLAMEFVSGRSLQERLETGPPFDLADILRIGMQTAAGLAAAHAQGLIHRDVKPSNILLENRVERVRITDFGLARNPADDDPIETDSIVGTPEFMAPEQIDGEDADCRADLFSLGSVLHTVATGVSPFRAETALASLRRVREERPPSLCMVDPARPAWLAEIVEKLLERRPADRYQSAAEVAAVFERRLAELPRGERASRPTFRWLRRFGAVFVALLAVAGLTAVAATLLLRGVSVRPDMAQSTAPTEGAEVGNGAVKFRRALAESQVSLSPPYEPPYPDAPTDRLSAQYAAQAICRQAGVPFCWDRGRESTEPNRRRWTQPSFDSLPADEALAQVLSPLGLTFHVDTDGVILVPLESRPRR